MKITVTLSSDGIGKLTGLLDGYEDKLRGAANRLVAEIAEIGRSDAAEQFNTAVYDGENDVVVEAPAEPKKGKTALRARGTSILFIEFGSGVHYSDPSQTHPLADEFGYERGGYGRHLGLNDTWRYRGSRGTNGVILKNGMILTHGNPANRCMYNAAVKMRDSIAPAAERIFGEVL